MEIAALTHQAGGQSITCRMQGDTFEMEDHRQWGDASFKTYNRPLAKPWPYVIEDGAALEQSVTLTWDAAHAPDAPRPVAEPIRARFPQMALVITPQDAQRLAASPEDLALVNPQRLLCHLDASLGDTAAQFAAFAEAQAAFDAVTEGVRDGERLAEQIGPAGAMDGAGLCPKPCDPVDIRKRARRASRIRVAR